MMRRVVVVFLVAASAALLLSIVIGHFFAASGVRVAAVALQVAGILLVFIQVGGRLRALEMPTPVHADYSVSWDGAGAGRPEAGPRSALTLEERVTALETEVAGLRIDARAGIKQLAGSVQQDMQAMDTNHELANQAKHRQAMQSALREASLETIAAACLIVGVIAGMWPEALAFWVQSCW